MAANFYEKNICIAIYFGTKNVFAVVRSIDITKTEIIGWNYGANQ